MGLCISIDIEGIEYDKIPDFGFADGKMMADIVLDVTDKGENLSKILSKKYNFDLTPLSVVRCEEDDEDSKWQNPGDLWKSAWGYHQALDKEGQALMGKEINYSTIDEIAVIDGYKLELSATITACKFAQDNGKRIRLYLS
jgi:hypothetical protein